MKPTVRELADEIRYIWTDHHIGMAFSRLRETDAGAVRGTIRVGSTLPEHRDNGSGRIWWSIVTLTTASDRRTLVGKLDKAAPRPDGWESDVDRCFEDCYERFTKVPEPVDLADVELVSIDTEHLFRPVLPLGQITLFLADQGSTKSYLMEYLSVCAVAGCESVFGPPSRQGPVIYFDWEVDEQVAKRRLLWICKGLGLTDVPRGLHYLNMGDRGRLLDRVRDMRYQIDRLKPVLVVIDSLTFATGGDLNTAEYAAPTMSAIGSLGEGLTKLISAHPNKSSRKAEADDISVIGSALFEYRARAIWLLKREQARAARFMVSLTTRKPFDGAPERPLAYRMHFDNAAHAARFERGAVEDSPELRNKTLPLQERIRRALVGGDLDTRALAYACDTTEATIRATCPQTEGVFTKLAGGGRGKPTVWTLAQSPDVPWWNDDDKP